MFQNNVSTILYKADGRDIPWELVQSVSPPIL